MLNLSFLYIIYQMKYPLLSIGILTSIQTIAFIYYLYIPKKKYRELTLLSEYKQKLLILNEKLNKIEI